MLDLSMNVEICGFDLDGSLVGLSPNGEILATEDGARGTDLRDAETGALIRRLGSESETSALAFSPDGRWLATTPADASIRIWDVSTGSLVQTLRGHQVERRGVVNRSGAIALAFSPDGELLASAGTDGAIYIWNLGRGHVVRTMTHPDSFVTALSLAFSQDGRFLAAAGLDATVLVWNTAGSAPPRSFGTPEAYDRWTEAYLAFSPDGHHILSAAGERWFLVSLWDTTAGTSVYRYRDALRHAECLAFSPDSRLLAVAGGSPAGGNRRIAVWDVQSQALVGALESSEQGNIAELEFSRGAQLLALVGSLDDTIDLWDVATMRQMEPITLPYRSYGFAFSPDGTHIAVVGENDVDVELWDVGTRTLSTKLGSRPHSTTYAVGFSADGHLLVAAGGGLVTLWDPSSGSLLETIKAPGQDVAVDPSGRFFSIVQYEGQVRIHEVLSGAFRVLGPEGIGWCDVALSPNGTMLAAVPGQPACIWRTADGAAVDLQALTAQTPMPGSNAVLFSPDGRLLATGFGGGVLLWKAPKSP